MSEEMISLGDMLEAALKAAKGEQLTPKQIVALAAFRKMRSKQE